MLLKKVDVIPCTEDQLWVNDSERNWPISPVAALRFGLTPAERDVRGCGLLARLAARLVTGLKAESRPEFRFEGGSS